METSLENNLKILAELVMLIGEAMRMILIEAEVVVLSIRRLPIRIPYVALLERSRWRKLL